MGEGLRRAFKAVRDNNAAVNEARAKARKQAANEAASLFYALLRRHGLPTPSREYQFHPTRKWRFDYAWVPQKVALEVDGGVWTGGRHTRGAGWLKDTEKLNMAACLGWRLLRTTPALLTDLGTIRTITAALDTSHPTDP